MLFCRIPFTFPTCKRAAQASVVFQRRTNIWSDTISVFNVCWTWTHWPLVAHTRLNALYFWLLGRKKGMLMERSHFCDPVASPGGRPETGRYMAGLLLWIPDLLVIWERFLISDSRDGSPGVSRSPFPDLREKPAEEKKKSSTLRIPGPGSGFVLMFVCMNGGRSHNSHPFLWCHETRNRRIYFYCWPRHQNAGQDKHASLR